nr:WASH complex subunit 2 isoform X2 [Leptinotarsa decemlineata]
MLSMESESKWNSDKAWTTDEILENANKWSLAGDVALLNTIKSFSKNMLRKTEELSQNIDKLLVHADEVSLKLDISQNQFHSLKNTQFIENRVYEDDETLDSKEEGKVVEKPPSEEDQEKMISESVILGLEIMNQYYEMVEVSISDTEEDEEPERSFILKPKDTYAHRPLPPVIGTDEWYKRWNSEDSSSDSGDDKMADIYSESDSEDNLPKDLFKGSETSSELDFSSQTSENRPVAHSTFDDSTRRPELVTTCEEQENSTVNASISSKLFAEQLAAKLDSVISTQENLTGQINKEPIQPVRSNTFCGNLFSDEPPPLSEPEDRLFPKSASAGIFSGGERLFDDVDSIHGGNQNKMPFNTTRNDDHKSENSGQKIDKNTSFLPKSSKVSKGLFDSDDSSDDDIFSTSKTPFAKPPFLKPSVPLFDNEPPKLKDEPPKLKDEYKPTEEVSKKKPTGGVSIFGNSNIFGNDEIKNVLKNQQQNITHDLFKEEEKNTSEPASVIPQQVPEDKRQVRRKQFSLFDDDTEDNFSQESKKVPLKKNNLFDDEDSDMENKVLIKKEYPDTKSVKSEDISQDIKSYDNVETEKKPLKNVSLFDDKFNSSLANKKINISLFDDDDDDELFKDDLFSELTSKKFKSNLFDSNDLFSEKTSSVDNTIRRDDLKNKNEVITDDTVSVLGEEKRSHSSSMDVEDDPKFENNVEVSVKDDSLNNNGLHVNIEENSIKREFMVPDVDEAQTNDKLSKLFEGVGKGLFDTEQEQQSSGLENVVSHLSPKEETTPRYDSEQKEDKVIVRLFDSTPPPDDDDGDWDTKSDNFSDSDDYTSYRADENLQRSNLFDDEPPSLGPNDSSGIVRDHSTRVYTDDSSFYPYASSSRRLSSDIFSEQQYQDSLFVTKSGADSATVPSNLDIIQEVSNISTVNITPSENIPGMETTDNKILDSENNFLAIDEPSIKNELEFAKDGESNEISSNVSRDHGVKNIFIDQNSNDHENNVLQSPMESEIKGSRRNSAISSIMDMLKNEGESNNLNIKVSPGKLRHSMNINVNALMPGYSPQKARELSKSQSLDSAKREDHTFLKAETVETSSIPVVRKNLPGTTLEKAVSFDDVDNVEVLHSVTKDRAKLPLNRRPSTRRGRQAAMRKSVIDDDSMLSNKQEKKEVEDVPNRMDVTPRKAEEDEIPSQEKKTESIFSEKSKDLNVSTEKDQVNKQDSSKEFTANKTKGLFDSGSESDNDLFSSSQAKSKKIKKLFDDESSDEDLFSTASSSSITKTKESVFKSSNKTIHKPASVKKLENIQTSEDPLSNLF